MTHEDFNELLADFQKYQRDCMAKKNGEYAPGEDKLENFKKGGKALGTSPEECLWGYCMKHIISVQDIVQGNSKYTPEIMREKIGDIANYLVLLEAIMREQYTVEVDAGLKTGHPDWVTYD